MSNEEWRAEQIEALNEGINSYNEQIAKYEAQIEAYNEFVTMPDEELEAKAEEADVVGLDDYNKSVLEALKEQMERK